MAPQAVDIAAHGHLGLIAPSLLRGHESGRPQRLPFLRRLLGSRGFDEAGDAKVDDDRHAIVPHDDVAGFKIAMKHAAFVDCLHRLGDAHQQFQFLPKRQSW